MRRQPIFYSSSKAACHSASLAHRPWAHSWAAFAFSSLCTCCCALRPVARTPAFSSCPWPYLPISLLHTSSGSSMPLPSGSPLALPASPHSCLCPCIVPPGEEGAAATLTPQPEVARRFGQDCVTSSPQFHSVQPLCQAMWDFRTGSKPTVASCHGFPQGQGSPCPQ